MNIRITFLRAIINICIQVVFPNMITYSGRTFKEEQNEIIIIIKLILILILLTKSVMSKGLTKIHHS